jgi:hypothetical protein
MAVGVPAGFCGAGTGTGTGAGMLDALGCALAEEELWAPVADAWCCPPHPASTSVLAAISAPALARTAGRRLREPDVRLNLLMQAPPIGQLPDQGKPSEGIHSRSRVN